MMTLKMSAMIKRLGRVCLMMGLVIAMMLPGFSAFAAAGDTTTVEVDEAIRKDYTPSAEELERMEKQQTLWGELIATYGEDVDWPLEVWAEYSRRSAELGIVLPDNPVYGLPAEDEVQLAEAMETAGKHLLETMGFQEEMLDRFSTYTQYYVTDPEKPYYQIAYNPKNAEEYEDIGAYFCTIDGKTGEVMEFLTPADAKG